MWLLRRKAHGISRDPRAGLSTLGPEWQGPALPESGPLAFPSERKKNKGKFRNSSRGSAFWAFGTPKRVREHPGARAALLLRGTWGRRRPHSSPELAPAKLRGSFAASRPGARGPGSLQPR